MCNSYRINRKRSAAMAAIHHRMPDDGLALGL